MKHMYVLNPYAYTRNSINVVLKGINYVLDSHSGFQRIWKLSKWEEKQLLAKRIK